MRIKLRYAKVKQQLHIASVGAITMMLRNFFYIAFLLDFLSSSVCHHDIKRLQKLNR